MTCIKGDPFCTKLAKKLVCTKGMVGIKVIGCVKGYNILVCVKVGPSCTKLTNAINAAN